LLTVKFHFLVINSCLCALTFAAKELDSTSHLILCNVYPTAFFKIRSLPKDVGAD